MKKPITIKAIKIISKVKKTKGIPVVSKIVAPKVTPTAAKISTTLPSLPTKVYPKIPYVCGYAADTEDSDSEDEDTKEYPYVYTYEPYTYKYDHLTDGSPERTHARNLARHFKKERFIPYRDVTIDWAYPYPHRQTITYLNPEPEISPYAYPKPHKAINDFRIELDSELAKDFDQAYAALLKEYFGNQDPEKKK